MGYMCEFCGEQRSTVYCRSDAACLCLSCDRNVHSANALSRRHSRTLVCERCNSQPAFVRCVEESLSLCQSCDWMGHGGSNSGSAHKRQSVNCYSGCPSAGELSSIWSFLLDLPSVVDSTCEQGLGSMSIADDSLAIFEAPAGSNDGRDLSVDMNDLENVKNSNFWKRSSMPQLDDELGSVAQPITSTKSTSSKGSLDLNDLPRMCVPNVLKGGQYSNCPNLFLWSSLQLVYPLDAMVKCIKLSWAVRGNGVSIHLPTPPPFLQAEFNPILLLLIELLYHAVELNDG